MTLHQRDLLLPYGTPPLTENQRLHPQQRARIVRQLRADTFLLAQAMQLPRDLPHCTVGLHYAPPDRRRRDADNLVPTLKACCDGLAAGTLKHPGFGLVADDTPDLMTKLMPVIEPPVRPARLWLTVSWETP